MKSEMDSCDCEKFVFTASLTQHADQTDTLAPLVNNEYTRKFALKHIDCSLLFINTTTTTRIIDLQLYCTLHE